MEIDLTTLLVIFDEWLSSESEEAKGIYHLSTLREDGLRIQIRCSEPGNRVRVNVSLHPDIEIVDITMNNCRLVRVLDEEKKCLEILHDRGRCFLALSNDSVIDYSEMTEDEG